MNKLDTLLEAYGLDKSELEFEIEGLSDEELEAKFVEVYGDAEEFKKKKKCDAEDGEESGADGEDEGTEEDYAGCNKKKKCEADTESEEDEGIDEDYAGSKKKKKCDAKNSNEEFALISFKISHDDIRYGIQNLLCEMNDEFHYYVVNSVYDNYFYYEDWADGSAFKQNYKMRKNSISFNGDPIPVFREFVTQEEKDKLEDMRQNYAALKDFKEQYDAAQLKAEKEAVFASADYANICESDEFKALVNDADKYSVDELKVKCDLLYAASMKKKFTVENKELEKKHSVGINFNAKPNKKKQAYAGLFSD